MVILRYSLALVLPLLALMACNEPKNRPPVSSSQALPPFVVPSAPTQPAPSPRPTPAAYLLSPGKVGEIRLNMTETALLAMVPAARLHKTTRELEGIEYPVYELRDAQRAAAPPLLLEMVGDDEEGYRIWRVRISDPSYRTADGIGVGSPLGAVRQLYGLTTVERTDAGLVAVSDGVRMSWLLDEQGLAAPAPRQLHPAEVPNATRITGVLLFR